MNYAKRIEKHLSISDSGIYKFKHGKTYHETHWFHIGSNCGYLIDIIETNFSVTNIHVAPFVEGNNLICYGKHTSFSSINKAIAFVKHGNIK